MDRLPAATSLATALLALERSRATGVLHVRGALGEARLAIIDGTPRALVGAVPQGGTLGDRLVRSGGLDARAHADALDARARADTLDVAGSRGPVGRWLVESGAARPEAVAHALREQLRERVRALFRWQAVEFQFVAGAAEIGVPTVPDAVRAGDLVLSAMRDALAQEPLLALRRFLGDGLLVLTPLGEALLDHAALWPDEAAMLPTLRSGAAVDALLSIARGSPRALRLLAALRYLRAASSPGASADTYALLLRKTREVRRAADAGTLLELAGDADGSAARRSLRRFAGALHPDRLGPDAPAALRRVSSDLVGALALAAERVARSA